MAYLINQYPQPSQSFIRREVAALEARGVTVLRYTLRRWPGRLVDPRDEAERQVTRAVLDAGGPGLLLGLLATLLTRPIALARALRWALRLGWRSERGPLVHLIYLAEACRLRRWLEQERVEHVHAHFGTNSAAVALLCEALGGPAYSMTVHGPEEFDGPRALGLGLKVERSAFTVAVSDFGRSQLYRWATPAAWPKVHVVRCGLDAEFLDPPPTAPPEARRLVCVGRLAEQKGQLLLIEAAARLGDFELVLIGDGPMRGEIEALIARLRLSARVRLAGWLSTAAVRAEILAARALVLPSFAEGLPVALMEALALHRPVISTFVAGIPELVRPGESGWLVPPGSVAALTEALRAALDAPVAELARLGRAGAARVAAGHDAAAQAELLTNLFRAAVRPRPERVADPRRASVAAGPPVSVLRTDL